MITQPVQALHVHGLEKSYDGLRMLRGVDFDVARGSILALLGSNGSGKTTVVKILSTLLKADAWTAIVNGSDVATHPADVRESISLIGDPPVVFLDEPTTGLDPQGRIDVWNSVTELAGKGTTVRHPQPVTPHPPGTRN